MTAPPVLELRDLVKTYGGHALLDIPAIGVESGVCTLLSGSNGAGKSTLLRIMAGLETPDHAQVTIAGVSRSWHAAVRQLRAAVIYLHQQPYLFDCSVSANVAYGLRCAGVPRRARAEMVDRALEWASLTHLARRNARVLSGGERSRVALTRARVLSPQALLLDEPTASMDRDAREQTYFLIRRLASEGIAIVLTSHELQPTTPLAERHLVLQDGKLHPADDSPNPTTPLTDASRESAPNASEILLFHSRKKTDWQ